VASLLEPPNGPRTTLLPPTVHDPTVVPSCRLPSPHRVPACPVRDTSQIPYRVKAAQEEGKGGGGALALALTRYGILPNPAREADLIQILLLDVKRVAPLPHNREV
jgi:hypothetical protein